jgi:polysaccharide export outer membrane protein
MRLHASTLFLSIVLGASAIGCASAGPYVWARDLPPDGVRDDYLINAGDMLGVRVFNQDAMSTHARVRSDGKIAVPMLGDVDVRGSSPAKVSKQLETRLKEYIVSPRVTVTVEESQPTAVSVLGEVSRPGVYTMDPSSGVLSALAAAGGFTPFASHDSIFVVRNNPPLRIRFTFASLMQADSRAASFHLRRGDVVVVE